MADCTRASMEARLRNGVRSSLTKKYHRTTLVVLKESMATKLVSILNHSRFMIHDLIRGTLPTLGCGSL